MDRCTPGYIVREEVTIEKINLEESRWKSDKVSRIKTESENAIRKECRREMDKLEWESTNWGKTMIELYEAGGTVGKEKLRKTKE